MPASPFASHRRLPAIAAAILCALGALLLTIASSGVLSADATSKRQAAHSAKAGSRTQSPPCTYRVGRRAVRNGRMNWRECKRICRLERRPLRERRWERSLRIVRAKADQAGDWKRSWRWRGHTLKKLLDRRCGRRVKTKRVARPAPVAAPVQGAKTRAPAATWRSGFEPGNFSEWSWHGQDDPTYVGLSVVDPASQGIPAREGSKVARFEVTAADASAGRYNSKLFEYVHAGGGDRQSWIPANVNGTYRASYWLPPSTSMTRDGSVNAFQFKDQAWASSAKTSENSEPSWEVQIRSAAMMGVAGVRPDHPVAYVRHGGDGIDDVPGARIPLPLGQWFELRAEVYAGDRIEYYFNDTLMRVARHSEFPVGHFRANTFNWIFGIGWYSSNPGVMYADDASFTAR